MSEEVKVKCAHCKHRLPKKICGCPESHHYNKQINMLSSCDFFEQNPAQPLYSKALVKVALGDEESEVTKGIEELEAAIKLGLPEDDKSYARFVVGRHYSERAYRQAPGDTDRPEFSHGIEKMEKAVLMDSQGGYGIFSQPLHKAELYSLAAAYGMVKDSIRQKKGVEQAVAYLEEKLHLFDYLSTPPLLLLLALGELYVDKADIELARQTFMRILQAPVSLVDDEHEANVREAAKHHLKALDSRDTKRSGCFIATAVYGGSDTTEIAVLRQFRDNFLLQNQLGRLFVHSYYLLSPPCAKLIEKSQLMRKLAKRFLLRPIIAIIQHTCGNTRIYDFKRKARQSRPGIRKRKIRTQNNGRYNRGSL